MAHHEAIKGCGLHLEKLLCSQSCKQEQLSDEEFVTWSSDEDCKDETWYPSKYVEGKCRKKNSITGGGKEIVRQDYDEKQEHAALVKAIADTVAVKEKMSSPHASPIVSAESPIVVDDTEEDNLKLIRKTRSDRGCIEVNTPEDAERREQGRRCLRRQWQEDQSGMVVDITTRKKYSRLVGNTKDDKRDMKVNILEDRERKEKDTRYTRKKWEEGQNRMVEDNTTKKEKLSLVGKRSDRESVEVNSPEDRGKKDKEKRSQKRQKQGDQNSMVVENTTEKDKLRLADKTRSDERGFEVNTEEDRIRKEQDRRYSRRQKQEDQSGMVVVNDTEKEKMRLIGKRSDTGSMEVNTPEDREKRENDRRYPRRQRQEDRSVKVVNNTAEKEKSSLVRKTRNDRAGMEVDTPVYRDRKESNRRYPRRQRQVDHCGMVVENTTEKEKSKLVRKTRSDRAGMEVNIPEDRERKENDTRYPRRQWQDDPSKAGVSGGDKSSLSDEEQKHPVLLKDELSSPLGSPTASAQTAVVPDDAEEKDSSRLIGKTKSDPENIEVNEPDDKERSQKYKRYPLRQRKKGLSEAYISGGDKIPSNSERSNCKSTRAVSGCLQGEHPGDEQQTDDEEPSYASDINGSVHADTKHRGTRDCEKPYICKKCGKGFATQVYLTIHRKIHTEEKPHICDICGMGFSLMSYLRKHVHIHSGKRPYVCDICGNSFTRIDSLTRHRRCHTRTIPYNYVKRGNRTVPREKPFVCDFCGLRFTHRSTLAIHQRTHTGERPYKCDICEMRFARSYSVKEHRRLHTGERPFVCGTCGKGYARVSNLIHHKRTHSSEKPFLCDLCGKRFTERYHLTKHKQTHSGDKANVCDS